MKKRCIGEKCNCKLCKRWVMLGKVLRKLSRQERAWLDALVANFEMNEVLMEMQSGHIVDGKPFYHRGAWRVCKVVKPKHA